MAMMIVDSCDRKSKLFILTCQRELVDPTDDDIKHTHLLSRYDA
jgi:hypothetical protein